MKFASVVVGVLCLLATLAQNSETANPMQEAAMMLVNNCKQKTGASDADINSIKQKKLPTTHEGLCLLECIFNTAHIMSNGKFNRQGTVSIVTPLMKGDAERVKKLKEMTEKCEKEISAKGESDKCKVAKLVVECTTKNGKAFGFQFPTHF